MSNVNRRMGLAGRNEKVLARPGRSRSLRPPNDETYAWHLAGACRGSAVDFFPDVHGPDRIRLEAMAKRVCADCPVRRRCLDHALAAGESYGVWGGTTSQERTEVLLGRRKQSRHRKRSI